MLNLINYFILAIVSYSGLLFGNILGLISPEEMKAGRIYFKTLNILILSGIIVYLLYLLEFSALIITLFVVALIILFTFFIMKDYLSMKNYYGFSASVYLILGFFYFLAYTLNDSFIIPSLIFLYGLPAGSLFILEHVKKDDFIGSKKEVILFTLKRHSFFFVSLIFSLISMQLVNFF